MKVEIFGEQMELLPQKAVFWGRERILFLADVHLGKVNHFRRSGIPVPPKANERNLELIIDLVNLTKPKRVICLGRSFSQPLQSRVGSVRRTCQTFCKDLV